jgi:hypothetical protein
MLFSLCKMHVILSLLITVAILDSVTAKIDRPTNKMMSEATVIKACLINLILIQQMMPDDHSLP